MDGKLFFKKNESFSIREGWISKVINNNNLKKTFSKNEGISELGIGSNMVKSLKYWVTASNIIEGKDSQLTDFGIALKENDPYLEKDISWFLIHYNLVTHKELCPIFYYVFTMNQNGFTKEFIVNYVFEKVKPLFNAKDKDVLRKYIEDDTNVFLKTYYSEDKTTNPEENYVCPLSHLNLLQKNKGKYNKSSPSISQLSPSIVYYVLRQAIESESFIIDDAIEAELGPCHIFNLDKSSFIQYLEVLQNQGLLIINRTAGLNTVYFNKTKPDYKTLYQYQKEFDENV